MLGVFCKKTPVVVARAWASSELKARPRLCSVDSRLSIAQRCAVFRSSIVDRIERSIMCCLRSERSAFVFLPHEHDTKGCLQ